jgi:hypothetical protein
MKIKDIYESTTSGAIATVASPMTTQSRNASIYGGKKGGNLLTGTKTKKKYANSISESPATDKSNYSVVKAEDHKGKPCFKVEYKGKPALSTRIFRTREDANKAIAKMTTVNESKMKELSMDLKDMDNGNFKKKYGKSKEQMRLSLGDPESKKTVHEAHLEEDDSKYKLAKFNYKSNRFEHHSDHDTADQARTAARSLLGGRHGNQIRITDPAGEKISLKKKPVKEAHLEEDDLILVPGQGHKLKTGFHKFDPDKAEHEGETLKNSLRTIARNAKELHSRLENHDQFPEWVSEKIGTIKGMMTSVTEYLISHQEGDALDEPTEMATTAGVIAGGGVGEAADPIAKRITVKKWGGNDMHSWAVLVDGKPAVTGLGKNEVNYYKNMVMKKLRDKPHLTGTNIEEAQTMSGALKNTLAKAETGSKLDQSIKRHNANIKAGQSGTLKNAPTGYHFDSKGYCRLGDK